MTRFTPKTEAALHAAGWYPGRDISVEFEFPNYTKLLPETQKILAEFGYLLISSSGVLPKENNNLFKTEGSLLWTAFDNTSTSQEIYHKVNEQDINAEIHQRTKELSFLEKKYGVPFVFLCGFDDIRYEVNRIYLSRRGELFTVDLCFKEEDEAVEFIAIKHPGTFDDFLNYILDQNQSDMLWERIYSRHSKRFNTRVKEVLSSAGWHDQRDIRDRLFFPPEKNVFYEASQVYAEFGYLDINLSRNPPSYWDEYDLKIYKEFGEYLGFNGKATLKMSLCPTAEDILDLNKVDYTPGLSEAALLRKIEKTNLTDTGYLNQILGEPCIIVGYLDDILLPEGFGWVVVTQQGDIYLATTGLYKIGQTFEEFLVKWIALKEGSFWGEKIEQFSGDEQT